MKIQCLLLAASLSEVEIGLDFVFDTTPIRSDVIGKFELYKDENENVERITFDHSGAGTEANIYTIRKLLCGRYSCQMKVASPKDQSKIGLTSALHSYFNNKTDICGNKITDNSEIDYQFLA